MRRIFSWILIIALSLGLCACGHNVETQWQEQYDLGVRCLSDGNYEEAKRSMYDEQGALTQYTVYNRDENGIILSADTYDASDALIRTANYG